MRTTATTPALRRPLIGGAAVLISMAAGIGTAAAATPTNTDTSTTAASPAGGPVTHGSGSAHLTPSQQGEARNYWCGPAALVSTLKEGGHGSRTQSWAAGVLHTTTNGTDMDSMLNGLNAYSGGFKYDEVFESGSWSSYVSAYESHLKSDINAGEGLVGNAYEVPGGPHLPGHPDHLIYHYIAIDGYSNNGATTHYADPATTVWSTVPAYSNISSSLLVRIMGGRGYYW
ncbi:C39 family peptidase [Catenulispora subtropica]|uniref:Peptidase C39-like domain-containing protein n=1 Tax=Catenulispora subtropica TaxID=450798 RepID=A0ABP5BQ08_9ACTN